MKKILVILIILAGLLFTMCTINGGINPEDIEDIAALGTFEEKTFAEAGNKHYLKASGLTVDTFYNVYLVDANSNTLHGDPIKGTPVTNLKFSLYRKDLETQYDSAVYYFEDNGSGLSSLESSGTPGTFYNYLEVATIKALDDELVLEVFAEDTSETGSYAVKVEEAPAPTTLTADTFTTGEEITTAGETDWFMASLTADTDYELFLVDSYNNTAHDDILTTPVENGVVFKVFKKDMTPYASDVYTSESGSVDGHGITGDTADANATLTASDDTIYIKVQAYYTDETGEFAVKYAEKTAK